jgi:hypothetical protein
MHFHESRMEHTIAIDEDEPIVMRRYNGLIQSTFFAPTFVRLRQMLHRPWEVIGRNERSHVRVLTIFGQDQFEVLFRLALETVQYGF